MKKKIIIGIIAVALLYILYKIFFKRGGNDNTGDSETPSTPPSEQLKKMFPSMGESKTTMSTEAARAAKVGYN